MTTSRCSNACSLADASAGASGFHTAQADARRISNGGTEAVNLLIEKVRRLAHGFRTFDHYRIRIRILPLHDFAQNQIWCAIVALACELLAWPQMLALPGSHAHPDARRWEHKRLRLRLLSIPARLVRRARRTRLRLASAPWARPPVHR